MAELDQINLSTQRFIQDKPALVDNVFQNDPLFAYAKLNVKEEWDGGSLIQEDFVFDGMIGGSFSKGDVFDVTEKQVEQGFQLLPKFFEISVPLSKVDLQVFNIGPNRAFSLLDSRLTAAYMTIGAHIAIAQYLAATAPFALTKGINGLAEAVNDGVAVSWDNNTYPLYGGITRGGQVGRALNSVPVNVNGTIDYNILEETYGDTTFGGIGANLGVTTVKGQSFIAEKFQPQLRWNDMNTTDIQIGMPGMKFKQATIIASRYCPGSDIATAGTDSNKIAVEYLTTSSKGAVAAYPALAVAASETLFWINAKKPFFHAYISKDKEFGFGMTGFKPAQNNLSIVAQVLACLNYTFMPRYHKQVLGITG